MGRADSGALGGKARVERLSIFCVTRRNVAEGATRLSISGDEESSARTRCPGLGFALITLPRHRLYDEPPSRKNSHSQFSTVMVELPHKRWVSVEGFWRCEEGSVLEGRGAMDKLPCESKYST